MSQKSIAVRFLFVNNAGNNCGLQRSLKKPSRLWIGPWISEHLQLDRPDGILN
jgi:hypothetical protein